MRTTLSIPDPYYLKVKKALPDMGYQTVNELLLDLIRHHFDVDNGVKPVKVHQIDVKPRKEKKVSPENVTLPSGLCKHGAQLGLCKFGCTKKMKVTIDSQPAKVTKPKSVKAGQVCEHGYLPSLCKFEKCKG